MNFLLQTSGNQSVSWLESLKSGDPTFTNGIMTAFAFLGILWVLLLVFKSLSHSASSNNSKNKKTESSETPQITEISRSSGDEIVAVIAAAIAMAESESAPGTKFRVVSFKRR